MYSIPMSLRCAIRKDMVTGKKVQVRISCKKKEEEFFAWRMVTMITDVAKVYSGNLTEGLTLDSNGWERLFDLPLSQSNLEAEEDIIRVYFEISFESFAMRELFLTKINHI